jgi:hypothetical protein
MRKYLKGLALNMQFRLSQSTKQTASEIFLSVISLSYFCGTAILLSPDSTWKSALSKTVQPVWDFCGLRQRWSMFSPRLRKKNLHTVAVVTFEDGTLMLWEAPRMERLRRWDGFRLERFRKWSADYLPWDQYKERWPDLARSIGRLNYNAQNKPNFFALHSYSIEIPETETRELSRSNLPVHTKYDTIFTYKYSDKDFQ